MFEYPLFIPPGELAIKPGAEWSSSEIRRYYEWLIAIAPERVRDFLAFLGEDADNDPQTNLLRIGTRWAHALRSPEFSYSKGEYHELANRGYALAGDAGLLVARILTEHGPGVRWVIPKRQKRDPRSHLPRLVGFGKAELDPIGGMIVEAKWVAADKEGPDILDRTVNAWRLKVLGAGIQKTDSNR